MNITHGARCAIRNHSTTNNITKLRKSLQAGPKYYLGNHELVIYHGVQNLQDNSSR